MSVTKKASLQRNFRKIIPALLMMLVFAASGCNSNNSVFEETNTEPTYGINFVASKYKSYFDASPEEIIQKINAQSNGNFPEFYQLREDSDRLWTQNGEYWAICFTSDDFIGADGEEHTRPYEVEIDLSALSSPEEAGYAIEAFIAAFLPDNVDDVTYNYDIYGENTTYSDTANVIIGKAGKIDIRCQRHESLIFQANGPLLEETSTLPIKPE